MSEEGSSTTELPQYVPPVRVSVVIAAYDLARWSLLERAVRSAQTQSGGPEVILAVDNNMELFTRARAELDHVTVVLNEAGRGASTTRNAGARAATGELLAFLDDDAEARRDWLTHLVRPLLDDPTVVGVGGSVTPSWPKDQPNWFPMEFGWVVGASYVGLPTTAAPVRNVWSENMAVRADAFAAVDGFREGFGKVGNSSRPEDTEFCVRLQEHARVPGARWWYEPKAEVAHHVPDGRATFKFFIRRCYAEGRGKAGLADLVGTQRGLASERSYVAKTLPKGVARGVADAARGDRTGLTRAGAIVAGVAVAGLGYVHEVAALRARRHQA